MKNIKRMIKSKMEPFLDGIEKIKYNIKKMKKIRKMNLAEMDEIFKKFENRIKEIKTKREEDGRDQIFKNMEIMRVENTIKQMMKENKKITLEKIQEISRQSFYFQCFKFIFYILGIIFFSYFTLLFLVDWNLYPFIGSFAITYILCKNFIKLIKLLKVIYKLKKTKEKKEFLKKELKEKFLKEFLKEFL